MLSDLNVSLSMYNRAVRIYAKPVNVQKFNPYNVKNNPDEYKFRKINPRTVDTLKAHLASAYKTTNNFLNNPNNEKNSFYSTIEKINSLIGNEYRHYRNYDPAKHGGMTLPEFAEQSKAKNISISGNDVQKVGNTISSRMLLKFNEGLKTRKGVFTEKSDLDYEERFINMMEEGKIHRLFQNIKP